MDELNPEENEVFAGTGETSVDPAREPQFFAAPAAPAGAQTNTSPQPQAQAPSPAQAPGWYPAPGGQRYWDGAQWTEHTAPTALGSTPAVALGETEERQIAMFAHLGQLLGLISGIGGFVVPLVLMLTKGKESAFVRRAAVESLNFWITGILAMTVSIVLLLILVGFLLVPVVALIWFALPIYAGIKANEGVDYRYPFNLRLIS